MNNSQLATDAKEFDLFSKQVSGANQDKSYILSVIVKRTYRINEKGESAISEDQIPLTDDIIFYKDVPKIVSHDMDLYPIKYYTDVIVKGKARTYQKSAQFSTEIQVGNNTISFLVMGNRKAYLTHSGEIRFTEPEFISEVPLRYDYAYGGRDTIAEEKAEKPPEEIFKHFPPGMDLMEGSHYRYPRNPAGKGFLVEFDKDSIELLELPNLEDPEDLLEAKDIILKDPALWYKMPLPRCSDWVDPMWFPRIAYLGLYHLQSNIKLPEVNRHWADKEIYSMRAMKGMVNLRGVNGASLGLQLPFIRASEMVKLTNIHPSFSEFVFKLPAEFPKIWIDGRKGKLIATVPVIHSIVIEPDENRLSIVWRGSGPAIRPYHEEELKTMPYKVEWKNK